MKPIISLFTLCIACCQIYAQQIEFFSGTAGNLIPRTEWTRIGTVATSPIQITETSLNTINSIVCNSIRINGDTGDESVRYWFNSNSGLSPRIDNPNIYEITSTKILYTAFPVRIITAPAGDDYFFGVSNTSNTTPAFRGKIFAKTESGKLRFGVLFGVSGTPTFTPADYDLNKTYQFVYKLNQSTKVVSLYIFEGNTIPDTEPETATITHTDGGASASAYATIAFRQVTGLDALVGGLSNTIAWPNAAILPVSLTSFSASLQNLEGNLNWSTASESNNKGFEIQRSTNGTHFTTIAFVNSSAVNGNSSNTIQYSYADKTMLPGVNYYRLKQTDLNNAFEYSKIVALDVSLEVKKLAVYPNPITTQINVKFNSNELVNKVVYSLSSTDGRVVYQEASDKTAIEIPAAGLTPGVFFLNVTNNGKHVETIKLLKN